MKKLSNGNLEFLFDLDSWMWGPCFHIKFFFEEKCPLSVFENTLLGDSIVSRFSAKIFPDFPDEEQSRRCILGAEHWTTPLGFIYYQMNRGDRDDYFLATYPRQVERCCGQFDWSHRNLENIQSIVDLHIELIAFVRRLCIGLGFHHVVIHHEHDPSFERGSLQSPGIIIYDWVAEYAGLEIQQILEPCYALVPFGNSMR